MSIPLPLPPSLYLFLPTLTLTFPLLGWSQVGGGSLLGESYWECSLN